MLNAILDLKDDARIESVTIIDPNLVPRIAGEKASIIDVHATDQTGRKFIVEMQVADVDGFAKRVQYYTCREYSMQIDKGDNYTGLRPAYFVAFLDFDFFQGKKYISNHLILDEETLEHKFTDLRFSFVELPKFTKTEDELETLVDKWIYFIKNANDLSVIPDDTNDEGLLAAYHDAERHNWTKDEWRLYDNAAMAVQDAKGRIVAALRNAKIAGEEKGLARGLEQGLEQGLKKLKQCWL